MTVEEIFLRAIELSAHEREFFLQDACGENADLRLQVDQLLAAHLQADSLLDTDLHQHAGESGHVKELGDFRILRELGRGGMGVVYEAQQKSLKRRVALKILSSGLGLSSKAILRFRREAEAAGKLHHTNIVPIYTTGEDGGVHYYAMELVDGPSLDAVVRELCNERDEASADDACELPKWLHETALFGEPSPVSASHNDTAQVRRASGKQARLRATADGHKSASDSNSIGSSTSSISSGVGYFDTVASMIADVADALDHAHQQGVIHRDIKPSNLLLSPDGRLSINDFGLARMLEQPGMTISGEFVGSPLYMSPEQITAGRAPLDHRTDIYSLGATLYEMLTLQPPFPAKSRDEVIAQILHKEPKPPRRINRKIPPDLETICLKSLERDPDRRYQTAGKMADDLRAFVNRHAISARRIGPLGRTWRLAKRHPSTTALILVIFASVMLFAWLQHERRREALRNAKEMVFLYSLSGDFEEAQTHIESARLSGATDSWLGFAEGQAEVFKGNYSKAQRILEQARNERRVHIPTEALLTFSVLLAGDEIEHVHSLMVLEKTVQFAEAMSQDDLLYLGLANVWTRPTKAMAYLNRAEEQGRPSVLLYLIRAMAARNVSWDSLDPEEAIRVAERAVAEIKIASAMVEENAFVLDRFIESQLTAAQAHLRSNNLAQANKFLAEAEQASARSRSKFPDNPTLNNTVFNVLRQTAGTQSAYDFARNLRGNQMDRYLKTYRLISRTSDSDLASAELDFSMFDADAQQFIMPLITLIRYSASTDRSERLAIKSQFAKVLQTTLSSPSYFENIGLNWAVSRLLMMENEAQDCTLIVRGRLSEYRDTYIGRLHLPIIALEEGKDAVSVESAGEGSRRTLCYAHFAIGIDQLTRGQRVLAGDRFRMCIRDGPPVLYVVHLSHAILKRWEDDPTWPDWIPNNETSEGRATE